MPDELSTRESKTEEIVDFIFDIGSYSTLFGNAWNSGPDFYERTVFSEISDPIFKRATGNSLATMRSRIFYGRDALKYQSVLKLHSFWKDYGFSHLAAFVRHCFSISNINPQKSGIIIIIPSDFSQKKREKIRKLMFQELQIVRIAFLPSNVCILTLLGLDTGVIINMGHFYTRIESIFKGFPNMESLIKYPIGGFDITKYLIDCTFGDFTSALSTPLMQIAEDVKYSTCECLLDSSIVFNQIDRGFKNFDYEIKLPTDESYIINRVRFEAPEIFFNSKLIHKEIDSLPDVIEQSIRAWERDQVPELGRSIILCGAGAKIKGLKERIQLELKKKFAESIDLKIIPVDFPKEISWKGASVIYAQKRGNLKEWEINQKYSSFAKGGTD